ncbi:MAG: 1-acyl-sn-glycerol-3-phosphate acyltransferase [Burkholderiales bacterium]|nr:1-acyl-sn-glycerol-3-phosphate acyltransferase [Burkholderiales bacterium]
MRRDLLGWLRIAVRLPPAVALLLGGLLTVSIVFPFAAAPRRARIASRWSRWLLRCCGIRLREVADERLSAGSAAAGSACTPPGCMMVANHVSWLDIFLVQASAPASFVAKAEIRRWPLIGWLVAGAGTLFIERHRRHAIHDVNQHIERALREGRRVAVFPEGTTGAGDRLLPFHGNLIEAALRAGAPIVPVGIRYVDERGEMPEAVRFIGTTTFVISFFRVLGEPTVIAETHYLGPVSGATRQAVAAHARHAIAERLRLPFDDELPQVVRALRARGNPARG